MFGRLIKAKALLPGKPEPRVAQPSASLAEPKTAPAPCAQDHPNCQGPHRSGVVPSEQNQPHPSCYGFCSVRTLRKSKHPNRIPVIPNFGDQARGDQLLFLAGELSQANACI